MNIFTTVHDQIFVGALSMCQHRVVYVAPGITEPVAEAVSLCLDRNPDVAVTVILDADPEVYRLGYGTVEGLTHLQAVMAKHQFAIRGEPGLRIGLFEVDGALLVYAPTPHLIEGGVRLANQTNALRLGEESSARLLASVAAEGIQQSLSNASSGLPVGAEIGQLPLTPQDVRDTLTELERIPPKAFNVARIERVFSLRLQYVEFEVTGYKLSARRVRIPNDLLLGDDPALRERLRNTFSLLEGSESLLVEVPTLHPVTHTPLLDEEGKAKVESYSEKRIDADRNAIRKEFLVHVVGYGWLIKRWDRKAFESHIEWFRMRVLAYHAGVEAAIKSAVSATVTVLAEKLLAQRPDITQMPARLRKKLLVERPTADDLLGLVVGELTTAFGHADGTSQPEIKINFKDLTYETIQKNDFREKLEAAYGTPGMPSVFEQLYEEFDAARSETPV
jgi:hypothetical protein